MLNVPQGAILSTIEKSNPVKQSHGTTDIRRTGAVVPWRYSLKPNLLNLRTRTASLSMLALKSTGRRPLLAFETRPILLHVSADVWLSENWRRYYKETKVALAASNNNKNRGLTTRVVARSMDGALTRPPPPASAYGTEVSNRDTFTKLKHHWSQVNGSL